VVAGTRNTRFLRLVQTTIPAPGRVGLVESKSAEGGHLGGEFFPKQHTTIILVHKYPTRYPSCTFGHGLIRNRNDRT